MAVKGGWLRWLSAGLVWSLVCSSATATAGKRKRPARGGKAAAVTVPSIDVLQSDKASTAASTTALPLDAAAIGLDLKTLARTKVTFTMSVPDPGFSQLDDATRPGLALHLAADSRWRVTSHGGDLMAVRRAKTPAGWSVDLDGIQQSADGAWYAALMLDGTTQDGPWKSGSLVSHGTFGGRPMEVATALMAAGPWEGKAASAMCVSGSGVSLHLFEVAGDQSRDQTTDIIEALDAELSRSIAVADMTIEEGYAMMAMPDGEPGRAHPVRLTRDEDGYDVRARLDPGAPGWTWVRLMIKGKPWQEELVASGTRERIGYSQGGDAGFLLQGQVPTTDSLSGTVVAEVWFLEDGGDTPRKLASETLEL